MFVILLLFGRIKNDGRVLLIIRSKRINEERIEALIFQYFSRKAALRVKNTTETSVEFIYEINKKLIESKPNGEKSLTNAVYEIGGIDYFNIVAQNDDVSS